MTTVTGALHPFLHEDTAAFLRMAGEEGWICEPWEIGFLLDLFPQGCFTVRSGTAPVAFVTSISYGSHGWIGNLLVQPEFRGRGFGRLLMEEVLSALQTVGTETAWLTASSAGKSLYERLGFRDIDMIRRWMGFGRAQKPCPPDGYDSSIVCIDRLGWGEARGRLIDTIASRASVYSGPAGFIMAHTGGGYLQLGPWGCEESPDDFELFDRFLSGAGERRIVFDAPAGNGIEANLVRRNFAATGSTSLMFRGARPDYRPRHIGALASLGSMG